jgi:hypothetical protein
MIAPFMPGIGAATADMARETKKGRSEYFNNILGLRSKSVLLKECSAQ